MPMLTRPIRFLKRFRDIDVITEVEVSGGPDSYMLLENALERDNIDDLIKLIKRRTTKYIPDLAHCFFSFDAVNCATAVLSGETAGVLDLRIFGDTPLQKAATCDSPRITALLLNNNGSSIANVRCYCSFENLNNVLPLKVALINLKYNHEDGLLWRL